MELTKRVASDTAKEDDVRKLPTKEEKQEKDKRNEIAARNAVNRAQSISTSRTAAIAKKRLNRVLSILLSKHPDGIPGGTDKRYVIVDWFVLGVKGFSTAEGTVNVEYDVQYWWMDEQAVGQDESFFKDNWNKIWNPAFEYTPMQSNEAVIPESADSYAINCDPKYGIISLQMRYKAVVDVSMDVHKFPYDSQKIVMKISSFTRPIWACEFIPLSTLKDTPDQMMLMTNNIELSEWDVIKPIDCCHRVDHAWDGSDYSNIYLEIPLRRRPQFYLSKVVTLIVIIALMSVGALVLDPSDLSSRFQVTLTLLLTQIAFNFVINEALPKVSYVTSLDKYFLSNYLLLVLEYGEHIATFLLFEHVSQDSANKLDYIMIAFSLVWVIFITAVFVVACFSGPPALEIKKESAIPDEPVPVQASPKLIKPQEGLIK